MTDNAYIRWLIALDFGAVPIIALAGWIAKADREENEQIARLRKRVGRREDQA